MPEDKEAENIKAAAKKRLSRRDFLVAGGTVVAAEALIASAHAEAATPPPAAAGTTHPASKGYLVYDSKKCAGCTTCMLSCSLVHYGVQNLSRSRIQVMQDSWGKFLNDVKMAPGRAPESLKQYWERGGRPSSRPHCSDNAVAGLRSQNPESKT